MLRADEERGGEQKTMKRTFSVLVVMLVMVALVAMSAAPAFATTKGGGGGFCNQTNGGVLVGLLSLPCLLQDGLLNDGFLGGGILNNNNLDLGLLG
jgi:hypothetical protein